MSFTSPALWVPWHSSCGRSLPRQHQANTSFLPQEGSMFLKLFQWVNQIIIIVDIILPGSTSEPHFRILQAQLSPGPWSLRTSNPPRTGNISTPNFEKYTFYSSDSLSPPHSFLPSSNFTYYLQPHLVKSFWRKQGFLYLFRNVQATKVLYFDD